LTLNHARETEVPLFLQQVIREAAPFLEEICSPSDWCHEELEGRDLLLCPAPAATRSCLLHYFDAHRRHSASTSALAVVACIASSDWFRLTSGKGVPNGQWKGLCDKPMLVRIGSSRFGGLEPGGRVQSEISPYRKSETRWTPTRLWRRRRLASRRPPAHFRPAAHPRRPPRAPASCRGARRPPRHASL
jgi:hypothetical protein